MDAMFRLMRVGTLKGTAGRTLAQQQELVGLLEAIYREEKGWLNRTEWEDEAARLESMTR